MSDITGIKPITQHQIDCLVDFSNRLRRTGFDDRGEIFVAEHVTDIRDLAKRLSVYRSEYVANFSEDDQALLTQLVKSIRHRVLPVLNSSDAISEEALEEARQGLSTAQNFEAIRQHLAEVSA